MSEQEQIAVTVKQEAGMVEPKCYWDPERDRPRGKELVRVKVKNRSTLNLQLPRGWLLQPGTQLVDLYSDEVQNVMAMVEPNPAALEQARHSCRLAIAQEAKARVDGFSGSADEFLQRVDRNELAEMDAYQYVLARTSLSPEAQFRSTMMRDPLPLDSCEIVERGIPEPQRESVKLLQAEQQRYTGSLGESIGAAIAQAQAPLIAQLAEQQKMIAELMRNNSRK